MLISFVAKLGHGAANVTLGIPRLREIVMTASTKPKTPSMTMSVQPGYTENDIQAFCKRASRLSLSQVVDKVLVNEQLAKTRRRQFTVSIHFYPKEEYREEYGVTPTEILGVFAARFPLALKKEIAMELKKLQADLKSHLSELGKGRAEARPSGDAGDEDDVGEVAADADSEHGDGDAGDAKRARQGKEMTTYESDDDDSGPLGEYDDAAIEAEHENSSDDEYSDEGVDDEEIREKTVAELVGKVREDFFTNLKAGSAFSFNEREATFDLEVCFSFHL